jgi:hypothetical protein
MALPHQPTALPQPMALRKRMPLLEDMPVAPTAALPVPRNRLAEMSYTPGSGPPPYDVSRQAYAQQSSGKWEWYGAPGPTKRGNMCVTHVDPLRGYGFQAACKK